MRSPHLLMLQSFTCSESRGLGERLHRLLPHGEASSRRPDQLSSSAHTTPAARVCTRSCIWTVGAPNSTTTLVGLIADSTSVFAHFSLFDAATPDPAALVIRLSGNGARSRAAARQILTAGPPLPKCDARSRH